jgi:hypothetical protein
MLVITGLDPVISSSDGKMAGSSPAMTSVSETKLDSGFRRNDDLENEWMVDRVRA